MSHQIKIIYIIILLTMNGCLYEEEPSGKMLIDIGDSLTAGSDKNSMSGATSKLLGDEWVVKNMGVGGENTLTIGARQGGIPMYIEEPIVIPADGSKVEISKGLCSSYNDENVYPLIQGSAGVNPCFVEGIKCQLSRSQDKYYINRVGTGVKDWTTQSKTTVITSLSKEKEGIATIFIGQNGGYTSAVDLLNQIDLFVQHKGDENVIIITSHDNTTPEIIQVIKAKYHSKHIDLKEYMSTQAIYDAIEYELLPNNGEYPTANDLEKMENNHTPPSLLNDRVHFNSIGYELLGRLRYQKGKELGYW